MFFFYLHISLLAKKYNGDPVHSPAVMLTFNPSPQPNPLSLHQHVSSFTSCEASEIFEIIQVLHMPTWPSPTFVFLPVKAPPFCPHLLGVLSIFKNAAVSPWSFLKDSWDSCPSITHLFNPQWPRWTFAVWVLSTSQCGDRSSNNSQPFLHCSELFIRIFLTVCDLSHHFTPHPPQYTLLYWYHPHPPQMVPIKS